MSRFIGLSFAALVIVFTRLAVFCVARSASGQSSGARMDSRTSAETDDPALRDYLSGNGPLNRGLYELSASEYRKFLSQHVSHGKAPVARYGLAVSLFRLEKHGEAIEELKRLRKVSGFEYAAEVATILGRCHLAEGKYDAAANAFECAVREHPDHGPG